jgi:hypothetical protein
VSPRKHPPIPGVSDKVSLLPKLSRLGRNNLDGALALYREALKLKREGKLRDEIEDLGHSLIMLQDVPALLIAKLNAIRERHG